MTASQCVTACPRGCTAGSVLGCNTLEPSRRAYSSSSLRSLLLPFSTLMLSCTEGGNEKQEHQEREGSGVHHGNNKPHRQHPAAAQNASPRRIHHPSTPEDGSHA